jgi:hypothetical protein
LTQVASQSAQFGPFAHDDYNANALIISDPSLSIPNTYHSSAIQQTISGLTRVPSDTFQGLAQLGHPKPYKVFGFEYLSDPSDPSTGYMSVDGKALYKMDATAVGLDSEAQGGSGVGQWLLPLEPMSIILNLGISHTLQVMQITVKEKLGPNFIRIWKDIIS